MAEKLGEKIERLLREGMDKQRIWQNLRKSEDNVQLVFLLNDLPTLRNRQTFLLLNLPLAAILLIMTGIKLFAVVSLGRIDFYFFLSLVVPMINIYVLKKILRFRRTGYLYLFVLSFLALFQPENHRTLEVVLLGLMLFLSGLLYLRMFPRQELLKSPRKVPDGQK